MLVIGKEEAEVEYRLEKKRFSDVGWREDDEIENIVSNNLEEIIYGEGSNRNVLLIGRQVVDNTEGRNDLVAVDDEGDLILLELKRDEADMKIREENVESQAIRYTASLANIDTLDGILNKIYYKYVERYKQVDEYERYARNRLRDFLEDYNIDEEELNNNQKIVLFSSGYSDRSLSSLAWLSKNGVDIRVLKGNIYEHKDELVLNIKRILPVIEEDDFFAGVKNMSKVDESVSTTGSIRMKRLMKENKLSKGDKLTIPSAEEGQLDSAILRDYNEVEMGGETMSPNQWAKKAKGYPVSIYKHVKHADSNKMLKELRQEVREESR